MTAQPGKTVANPFDMQALLEANGCSAESTERAYRAWAEGIGRVQDETAQFLKNRATEDFAAVEKLARCATLPQMVELQTGYAIKALSDFVSEGQKLGAIFSDTVRKSAP